MTSRPRKAWNAAATVVLGPGIVTHESAHWLACRLCGVRTVGSISIDPFGDDAFVDHERVDAFPADFAIAVAPLLCNTLVAVAAFRAGGAVPWTALRYAFLWIGASSALTAFPSRSDTSTLFRTVDALPRWARPLGYLLAGPVRAFTLVPGAAGVAGYLWAAALFALTQ